MGAALSAELGAALTATPASLLPLFAPPHQALHPFLPVLLGALVLPLLVAGAAFAVGRLFRAERPGRVAPSLRVVLVTAVRGCLPLYFAGWLLAAPAGAWAVTAGAVASGVLWASAYRRELGIPPGLGAQCLGLGVLAALGALPLVGALLATLA